MKTVIKFLKKRRKEWKQHYASERYYFKGEEQHKFAKQSFRECEKHIAELDKAILILENDKRSVSEADEKSNKEQDREWNTFIREARNGMNML